MNYGEVKTQFTGLLNRRDCTDALKETFLQQAITRIQRDLRIPAMERSASVTLDGTYDATVGIAIPNDYLELIDLTVNTEYTLRRVSLNEARYTARNSSGNPRIFARSGTKWILGPTPVTGDTPPVIAIDYYADFLALVSASDSNFLTTSANDLVLYSALSYAADYFNDKRGDRFEQRYGQIFEALEFQGDADELSGSAVVRPAYCYPDDEAEV